jgi:ferrous iron transport protein B
MRYAVLFGPPNVGKSTLFNHLTKQYSSVINYPGSTVDVVISPLKHHHSVTLIDAPGIQSLMPRSDDERLALKTITQLHTLIPDAHSIPDLIICVIDATKADRHLAISKRLIDDGYPVMIVLTMMDEAEKKGIRINHIRLAESLGVSVFKVNARLTDSMTEISSAMALNSVPCQRITKPKPCQLDDMLIAYDWAKTMMASCQTMQQKPVQFDPDQWLLHPIFGYVLFLAIMIGFFCSLFFIAAPFMDAIDAGFTFLGGTASQLITAPGLNNFVVNGVLAGLGGVVIFVPQIALLFFGLGIMESSGFLARSAVLIDYPLSRLGLNGRSFVPLLSGFACAIPAILATRVISNQRVRLLTLMAIPLMQCSARLPVYGLLLGALFVSPLAGAIGLTAIYLGSIMIAGIIVGIANRYTPSSNDNASFIIELPAWQWPLWRQLLSQTLTKTSRFLLGAGPIIWGISLVIWVFAEVQFHGQPLIHTIGQWIEPIFKPMGVDWKVGVAILLSFAAREVFVSALAIVYQVSEQALMGMSTVNGLFNDTGAIIGLVLFFMVAMQCGATFAVLKKEMQQIKWPIILLVGYIALAYVLAVLSNVIF